MVLSTEAAQPTKTRRTDSTKRQIHDGMIGATVSNLTAISIDYSEQG